MTLEELLNHMPKNSTLTFYRGGDEEDCDPQRPSLEESLGGKFASVDARFDEVYDRLNAQAAALSSSDRQWREVARDLNARLLQVEQELAQQKTIHISYTG